jgi:hypothetical protein
MLKHVWTVVCKASLLDKETENWSLIEVVDYIDFSSTRHMEQFSRDGSYHLDWLTQWRRENIDEPDRGYGRDIVLTPSGKTMMKDDYQIDLSKYPSICYRREMLASEFTDSGDYMFLTYAKSKKKEKWTLVSDIPIYVNVEKKLRKSRKSKSKANRGEKNESNR